MGSGPWLPPQHDRLVFSIGCNAQSLAAVLENAAICLPLTISARGTIGTRDVESASGSRGIPANERHLPVCCGRRHRHAPTLNPKRTSMLASRLASLGVYRIVASLADRCIKIMKIRAKISLI